MISLGGRTLSHVRILCAFQRTLSLFDAVLSDAGLESQARAEVSGTSLLSADVSHQISRQFRYGPEGLW